jgi:hypothetical protein
MMEVVEKFFKPGVKILDVGGIPSSSEDNRPFIDLIDKLGVRYSICDFRGGEYKGDFVTYDFKDEKFDIILFLSSLEHFPQCTEGDMSFRDGEDKKGFEKALSILSDKGKIILTVPFGKHRWQPYHQNYDMDGILDLSKGSRIIEHNTYKLEGNKWIITLAEEMKEIIYDTKANGVGCFVFEKE